MQDLIYIIFGTYSRVFSADLKFFKLNSYSIQFVFYVTYINMQIALAFLASTLFSNVRTATGIFKFM